MTCWPTDEGWDTTLVLALLQMDGWCVVPERMLVSILSVSVDLHVDLKAEDLLSPLLLMWVFKKLNLL